MDEKKHPYVLYAAVILVCLIALVVCLLMMAARGETEPEFDEDTLLSEAEKLAEEGEGFHRKAKDLRWGAPKFDELMRRAYGRYIEAHELLEKIIIYRQERGLQTEGTRAYQLLRNVELELFEVSRGPDWDYCDESQE
jgi:hypothetical protein